MDGEEGAAAQAPGRRAAVGHAGIEDGKILARLGGPRQGLLGHHLVRQRGAQHHRLGGRVQHGQRPLQRSLLRGGEFVQGSLGARGGTADGLALREEVEAPGLQPKAPRQFEQLL